MEARPGTLYQSPGMRSSDGGKYFAPAFAVTTFLFREISFRLQLCQTGRFLPLRRMTWFFISIFPFLSSEIRLQTRDLTLNSGFISRCTAVKYAQHPQSASCILKHNPKSKSGIRRLSGFTKPFHRSPRRSYTQRCLDIPAGVSRMAQPCGLFTQNVQSTTDTCVFTAECYAQMNSIEQVNALRTKLFSQPNPQEAFRMKRDKQQQRIETSEVFSSQKFGTQEEESVLPLVWPQF